MSNKTHRHGDAGRDALYGVRSDKSEDLLSSGTAIGRGHTHDEPSFAAPPEHDEDFDRVSRLTHKRLPFECKGSKVSFWQRKEQKGVFSFQADKRDILPFERKRKRKRPGGIFRVSPWEPQNSSHPHKGRASKRGTTAPLSKGARVTVCKRINK